MELVNVIQLVASSVLIVISLCIIHIITELRNENEDNNKIIQKLKSKVEGLQENVVDLTENVIDLNLKVDEFIKKQTLKEETEKKIEKFIEEQNAKKADNEEASFYE